MTATDRGASAVLLLARLDSRRLPGKGLADLGGRPLL
ncbi:MAG: 3-deoxy-manno-octulosonate cytidylyltransferase, partial [Gammaproteobacteria bacterium]|nr:3-deoxy-manno-octulosonate cytidylyltransferase [Gammaproteobacteria bacterium]